MVVQPDPASEADNAVVEDNKALMRRYIEEVWNRGNLDVADELFDQQATTPGVAQLPAGPEGAKIITRMFRSAFPDFNMTIEDMLAEGDKVVARFSESGTHQGEFMGAAPTGRRVQFTEIAIIRVAGGKVIESWFQPDMLGLCQQLGLVPQTI